jgi:hypothetical protein
MAISSKIRVMISSRCNDQFPFGIAGSPTLTEIRRGLKVDIEAETVFGAVVFEVWINEEEPPRGGTWDSWDVCIEAVKDCDILLVLSNGNAGWARNPGEIGICHAELMAGFSLAPGKVWLISLCNVPIDASEQGQRNKRFQDYIADQSLFRGGEVRTVDELKERVRNALRDSVVKLMQRGVREASKGRFHSGQALDWSRLNFPNRQAEMVRVLRDAILQRSNSSERAGNLFIKINNNDVMLVPHGVPASFSVSAAKEMVGQPFLKDHTYARELTGRRIGPFHLIGCHKGVTETQAEKVLGFPDATFVNAPFGIYVADNIQKVQLAFIRDCRDEATTRHGVQRFFDWLDQTGEADLLAIRAKSRAKIVKVIANQI